MAAATQKDTQKTAFNEVTARKTQSKLRNLKTVIFRKLLKFGVVLVVLLAILTAGFLGAAYFKLIDPAQLEAKIGISQYPILTRLSELAGINKKAVTEPTDQTPVEIQPQLPTAKNHTAAVPAQPQIASQLPNNSPASLPPVPPDDTELKRQEAQKRAEEQKRISKVARLYDGMKPEEAAPILNELDDRTVILIFNKMEDEKVAKILSLFDPKRSARISDTMLKGIPQTY